MDRELIITLDGIPTRLKAPDLNKDGKTGGTEDITQHVGPQLVTQNTPSELGDTLKELNRDDLDPQTNMSGIDMRSIIHPLDITNLASFDSLIWLDFLPVKCLAVTRKMLRLSVSQLGKGREHMVDVATGKRMFDAANGGVLPRLKNFLGGNKNQEQKE